MSKKNEQEYINNLKEDILELVRDLRDISDGIDDEIEYGFDRYGENKGHLYAVIKTCEELRSLLYCSRENFKDEYYYDDDIFQAYWKTKGNKGGELFSYGVE